MVIKEQCSKVIVLIILFHVATYVIEHNYSAAFYTKLLTVGDQG